MEKLKVGAGSGLEGSTGKPRIRFAFRIFLWGMAMSICSKASIAVMENWAVPLWLRIPLALSPLLPLVALALTSRTRVKSDELDLHIHREAVTFAFYGLFVILICVELLIRGRVLAGFVWTVETLITAMLLVLGLGYVWIWRRYR